jgi:hypothetical protein
MKIVSAVTALALTITTAIPAGHAATNNLGPAVVPSITRDLGVPNKPQPAHARITSGNAGRNSMRVAYYCWYQYYYDDDGNIYRQLVCQ